jgi:hypothetical protein
VETIFSSRLIRTLGLCAGAIDVESKLERQVDSNFNPLPYDPAHPLKHSTIFIGHQRPACKATIVQGSPVFEHVAERYLLHPPPSLELAADLPHLPHQDHHRLERLGRGSYRHLTLPGGAPNARHTLRQCIYSNIPNNNVSANHKILIACQLPLALPATVPRSVVCTGIAENGSESSSSRYMCTAEYGSCTPPGGGGGDMVYLSAYGPPHNYFGQAPLTRRVVNQGGGITLVANGSNCREYWVGVYKLRSRAHLPFCCCTGGSPERTRGTMKGRDDPLGTTVT